LVSADEQNDFPFCPITDAVDIAEDDREKNDLADEPKALPPASKGGSSL